MLMREVVPMMAQQLPMQRFLLQMAVLPVKITCVALYIQLPMVAAVLVMARQHTL